MKFAIDKHHRDFFEKQGYIEFENFLTSDQTAQFNHAINCALQSQLETSEEKFQQVGYEKMFLKGRDLWRCDALLSKLTCQARLGEFISELTGKKPIRLGYTQLFPSLPTRVFDLEIANSSYLRFLHQKTHLESISSVNNVLCGMMISLSEPVETLTKSDPVENEAEIFPNKLGSAILFRPEATFNLEQLFERPRQRYYLIVYTLNVSLYFPQPNDPFGHAFKQLGYIYNERLSDKLNPVVYR